jgi:hypothetical protein
MMLTDTTPRTRAVELLLVRLLAPAKKPAAPARLRDEMNRLMRDPLDAERWRLLVDELAGGGLLKQKPLRLTEAGRARALEVLGLKEVPPRDNWRTLRDRYLVPQILGVPPEAHRRVAKLDGLGACLLNRRYALPQGSGQTLNAALEALACRVLGFPEETSLADVRDRVLSRLLNAPERLNRQQLARQMVQSAAKARRADLAGLREAVLRDWVGGATADESPSRPISLPGVPGRGEKEAEREREPFDLAAFAATVRAAARACPTGRFGENKVFTHYVWRQLRDEPNLPVGSLDEFKRRLAEANHAGLLHLSRADLVQAMNADDVRQSETHYLDAVFHFILIEGGRP